MMKINILIPLLLTLIFSCDGNKQVAEENKLEEVNGFRSYPIDMNAPKVEFTDMVDEMHIIGLEETDESLLSFVSDVKQNDEYFYFFSGKANDLFFYSKKGKFIRKINRQGEGPGEYKEGSSTWVVGDTLKIFDHQNNDVLSYNMAGEFIKSESLPLPTAHLFPTTNGYWLDVSHRIVPDSAQHEIIHVKNDMESLQFELPVNSTFGTPLISTNNNFKSFGADITYKHNYKDTLYLIENQQVKPFIHFDFGDENLWKDPRMRTNINGAFEAMQSAGKVWLFHPYVGQAFIYLSYNSDFDSPKYLMIHRESGKVFRINSENSNGAPLLLSANSWDEDRLLMSLSSIDLGGLLEGLTPSQCTFEDGSSLEEIESSENPVIAWVKFKMPER